MSDSDSALPLSVLTALDEPLDAYRDWTHNYADARARGHGEIRWRNAEKRSDEARAEVERLYRKMAESAEKWEAWASHQEWCRSCAESSPRDCSDGALLWARCHVDDAHEETRDEARKIVTERDP